MVRNATRAAAVLAALGAAAVGSPGQPVPPSTRAGQMEKLLPEFEAAADGFEKELHPLLDSKEANVRTAVDCALLQIRATRSVRRIVAEQPDYLTWHVPPADLARWKDGAEYYLACARAGKDPFAGAVAGVRPFRSKIDGQLLLYHVTLPRGYDPARKYPLRVDLHSGGGFTWLAGWVRGKPDTSPNAASRDAAIHISPAGRQHVGIGESAVLDALADVQKHYAVDPDRVVIGGWSMGGTGGFHFGTFFPDRFAAAYSGTGGACYAMPAGNGRFDAHLLGDNLSALPFLIWDTPGDGHYQANRGFAEGLRERAKTFPGCYPSLELTDPKGGHGIIDRKLRDQGWEWMAGQVRNPHPRRVVYKTYCLRYDGAYWARVDTVEDPTQPARIEAEMTNDGCRVAVENADRFHLDLAPPLAGAKKNLGVRVNGGGPLEVPAAGTTCFAKTGGRWAVAANRYPDGLVKKHGVSGPIQDVFMEQPVLMVYGTAGAREPAEVTRTLDAIVTRLLGTGDGSGVLRTGFERKADGDVTAADVAEKNLILVGTPTQNRFLARVAGGLPAAFLDDGVRVGGKEHRGAGVSLVMVYPNPLNPDRYVLLMPEEYWGEKPWEYPDYVVFRAPPGGKGRASQLAKGTFDARWK